MDVVIGKLESSEERIISLEHRIGSIEMLKSTLLGVVAAISLIVSLLGAWILKQLGIG